jgi:hypothetical protein
MGIFSGANSARTDIETSRSRLSREDDIKRLRDNAADCRGKGDWSDDDIDDYVDECNRQLYGR